MFKSIKIKGMPLETWCEEQSNKHQEEFKRQVPSLVEKAIKETYAMMESR